MEFFSWKRLIIQCYNLFCKGSACFDVVDIEWVQIVLQNCEKLQNDRAKKEQILSKVCMIKKGLIVLFTGDVLRKSMFKRLVYTPPDSSPRFTSKLNLSNTKNPAWFFILASLLLDRGMERVNWLPPRTIVCFIKLYFGAVQLSIVSKTELLERLWIKVIKLRWWATGLFCMGIDHFG